MIVGIKIHCSIFAAPLTPAINITSSNIGSACIIYINKQQEEGESQVLAISAIALFSIAVVDVVTVHGKQSLLYVSERQRGMIFGAYQ